MPGRLNGPIRPAELAGADEALSAFVRQITCGAMDTSATKRDERLASAGDTFGLMIEVKPAAVVECQRCGAWADIDPISHKPSWNMREVNLCKEPPIATCPAMQMTIRSRLDQ